MKQLSCEMCGSTALIKDGGLFVCQSCGCKYTIEEAKKMMIEGTVDVSGSTIKVDNSVLVRNCLTNARRAKAKNDWEEVERYYNIVEENDPRNIEAIFYSSYASAMLSLSEDNRFKRQQKFDVLRKSISIIDDSYDVEKTEELMPIIQAINEDINRLSKAEYADDKSKNSKNMNVIFDEAKYFNALKDPIRVQFIESIENILKKDEKPYLYRILISNYRFFCTANALYQFYDESLRNTYKERMQKAIERLAEIDPTYQQEAVPKAAGCYVATAVYGSYDCPQVWTLRRYRDYTLADTWHGRAFIRAYYTFSPTIVKWFGHSEWFKKMWKGKLDRMVANLNADGVEDTPYNDRNW